VSPEVLLAEARKLLDADDLGGAAPRGAALLTRQALERAVWDQVRAELELREDAPFTVVLLCLQRLRPEVGARVAATWSGLSRACHAHGYELPPAPDVLLAWITEVDSLVRSRTT
jgi:hypothetical protein